MPNSDEVAHRLALLQSVAIASSDLDAITKDIEDNLRIVAELEEFSKDIRWTALQLQPPRSKV